MCCVAGALLLFLVLCDVRAFNIETRLPVMKSDDDNSWFGASVVFHIDNKTAPSQPTYMMLVGAPLANRTYSITKTQFTYNAEREKDGGLYEPGAVFRCSINDNSSCREVPFDQEVSTGSDLSSTSNWWPLIFSNNKVIHETQPFYRQSRGFFGYYLKSAGPGKGVAACGHRISTYTQGSDQADKDDFALSFAGGCMTASNDLLPSDFNLIRYCYDPELDSNKVQRGCLGGIGLGKFIENDVEVFMSSELAAVSYAGVSSQMASPNSGRLSNQVPSSLPLYTPDQASFGGFQNVEGKINNQAMILVSSPRVHSYVGRYDVVGRVFFSTVPQYKAKAAKRDYLLSVAGEQYGAQFGFSMATGKFTDKSDTTWDAVIAAPFYTDYSQAGKYDHGRVYIYHAADLSKRLQLINNVASEGLPSKPHEAYGMQASVILTSVVGGNELAFGKAYFGYSLANGGDMNNDGFEELIVGAPGGGAPTASGGTDGKGAVYIFYGRHNALDINRPQIIYATDLDSSLQGFGNSIAGGRLWDMDSNGYTDLAVGARKSNRVYFFKSRPVVQVMAQIEYFDGANKITILDLPKCNTSATCFTAKVCFYFKNFNLRTTPKSTYSGHVNVSVSVCEGRHGRSGECAVEGERRLRSPELGKSSIIRINGPTDEAAQNPLPENQHCIELDLSLQAGIREKLAPFLIVAKWNVIDEAPTSSTVLTPLGTRYGNQYHQDQLRLLTRCKLNVCHPDLAVNLTRISWPDQTSDAIVLGTPTLTIGINVTNHEEPASQPVLMYKIPRGVLIQNLPLIDGVSCNQSADGLLIDCPLPNPFYNITISTELEVSFDIRITHNVTVFEFEASIRLQNSSSPEFVTDNNILPILVYTTRHTDFLIASPSNISVLLQRGSISTPKRVADVGPHLREHQFSVLNNGPSALPESQVEFSYPGILETNKDDTSISYQTAIFYLSDVRADPGITCAGLESLRKAYQTPLLGPFTHPPAEEPGDYNTDCSCSEISCNWYCRFSFTCTLPRLIKGATAGLTLEFRLSNTSLPKRLPQSFFTAMTFKLPSRFTEPNFSLSDGSLTYLGKTQKSVILTSNQESTKEESANIGVIIGAVIGGIVLVVLIVIGLYKCGFFKRKLPPGMDDGQNWQQAGDSGTATTDAGPPPATKTTDV